ncbi:hypothetical protein OLMES_0553 [Oleiphilus messinensis]|uniref:Uncharacterized protein n=1 Tax=Oleiphilus messinensis TaxID=141451 RepID=A0A1Y0I4F0_9GAMM|nr:hypothetical protein [Oleiphilus messinensis]ARU54656.1 hypothetical protein OLMES_0553 [Oleiphilus messinensis]
MTPRQIPKKIDKARILRAVASSSAIETGEAVAAIEKKLKRAKESKFGQLTLAE